MSRMHSRSIQSALIVIALSLASCATGLTRQQQEELDAYAARGLKVERKNETTAMWLGFAPGFGSFYTGHIGLGILNFFLWPLSMCWDPVSGIHGAKSINYEMTVQHVHELQNAEMEALDARLRDKKIDNAAYAVEKEKILQKYRVP